MEIADKEEQNVLNILNNQINKIVDKDTLFDYSIVKAILVICNSWWFPVIFFNDYKPDHLASLLASLRDKGLIKVFEYDRLPSFIPIEIYEKCEKDGMIKFYIDNNNK